MNRRSFLRNLAGAAAVLAVPVGVLAKPEFESRVVAALDPAHGQDRAHCFVYDYDGRFLVYGGNGTEIVDLRTQQRVWVDRFVKPDEIGQFIHTHFQS